MSSYVELEHLAYPEDRIRAVVVDKVAARNPYPTGYGAKIPTRYMLILLDSIGKRQRYRVYVACYGNASTVYVGVRGERRVLSAEVEALVHEAAAAQMLDA